MNYGETLAYWYLRLNGFFPLKNFVMHMPDSRRQHCDCDLLAVRFPYVSEDVGGAPGDWDNQRFAAYGLTLSRPIALIVQVKTGERTDDDKAFARNRVTAALGRIGLWGPADVEAIAQRLETSSRADTDAAHVAKLLIAPTPCDHPNKHLSMLLSHALEFIQQRFKKYAEMKSPDRLFFNDELIQFLASQAGLSPVLDG